MHRLRALEQPVRIEPYPYRARAWRGETLVADSGACRWAAMDGEPAMLWFPAGSVEGLDHEGGDELAPTGAPVVHATASVPGLEGYVAVDPELVRIEVVDGLPGDATPDITLKRFPTWGDARDLVAMLDVRALEDGSFSAPVHSDGKRPVVEGSQILGQAIVAACRHAPGRRAVWAGMAFLRAADARRPLRFELRELSAGRLFSALGVRVRQEGRDCATGTVLLNVPSPDVVRHEAAPPSVAGPYECPPYDMGVTGRDIRVVDNAYTNDSNAPIGPPTLDAWVRFRHVPDDPALHAGLLAQFTGHMPIAAALRPHAGVGQDQAHRTLSTAINAISLSLHTEVRADEWMLYHHLSTFAGDGMTHAECRVHDDGGQLLASFSVDAMVRPFPAESAQSAVDERTAL